MFRLTISIFLLLISFGAYANNFQTAIFAGGCFWCMQPPYDKLVGVKSTEAGYIGGTMPNPTYRQVSAGQTNYVEAVKIIYDPTKVSYPLLLTVFWHNIDPTVKNRQFCDTGSQYRSAIFYLNPNQQKLAEQSKQQLLDSKKFSHIYTEITKASKFYPAEAYHQEYYKKNPTKYKYYRFLCGRDKRLKELWGNNGKSMT